MSRAGTVPVPERARRPRLIGAPHPQLQALLARDYGGFTGATTPSNGFALPARAAVVIILTLQDSPRRPPAVLAGAHNGFWASKGACPPAYLELWLAPLGAYRLLGMPMDALCGRLVDLTDVLGTGSRRLADQLRDTPSWQQRFRLLDEYLLRRAEDGPEPAPVVAWAWRRLIATRGKVPIGRLAQEIGWSHKHLITKLKRQIGLSPKTAARLVRLDAVWRRLAEQPPARWDAIAADSGWPPNVTGWRWAAAWG
jgi:AraC-like DNA-binding protein